MPFDIDQWIEEKHQELIRDAFLKLKPEERIAGLKPEERVAGLKPEERVAGLKPEERLAGMSPDELEVLQRLLDAKRSDGKPK